MMEMGLALLVPKLCHVRKKTNINSIRIHTRSTPRPPARVDIKKMNISLSALLYSFMLSCLDESDVCPSMLPSANTNMKWIRGKLDSHVISAKNAVQEQHVKMKQRLSMHNT
jgi:hypothetical protein